MYIDPIQSRIDSNELNHRGVLGMKWGVRRYQNKDGSLTGAGRRHYGYGDPYKPPKAQKAQRRLEKKKAKQEKYDRKMIDEGINSFKSIQNTDLKDKKVEL